MTGASHSKGSDSLATSDNILLFVTIDTSNRDEVTNKNLSFFGLHLRPSVDTTSSSLTETSAPSFIVTHYIKLYIPKCITNSPLRGAISIIKEAFVKTTQIPDFLGEIKEKLDNILVNNPGHCKLCQIDDFPNTQKNIELPETVPPSIILNFKYCPTTSVDFERSFSAEEGDRLEEPLRHLRFEFQPAQKATQSSRPEEKRLRSLQIPRYSSRQQSPKATVFDGIHGVRTSLGLTHESRKQFIWVVHPFVVQVNGLQVLLCSVRETAAQSNGGATVDQVALGAILTPDRFSGGETERRLSEGQSTREIPQIFVPVQTLHHQRKEGTETVSKPLEGSRRANRPGRRSFETQTVEYNSGVQGERRQAVRNLQRWPGSFKFINEQLSQAPSRKSGVGLDSGWQMG
ncbi:hypothetical protein TKK_0016111 [Trichogramma kaykai]